MFLNELKNIPDAQIIITYENGRIVGFIQSELSISGGNDFVSPLNSSAIEGFQESMRGVGAAAETIGRHIPFMKKTIRNFNYSFQFAQQTTDDWKGSEKPVFSIDLTFVAESETDDVRKQTNMLYKTVYPQLRTRGIKWVETPVLTAPLGYKISAEAKAPRGTVAIQVGRWFKASEQVMRRVGFSFSKEIIANGSPLYAVGRIEFHPFKQPDVDTFLNYFIRT